MDHVPGGQLMPALKHWRQLPLQWVGARVWVCPMWAAGTSQNIN